MEFDQDQPALFPKEQLKMDRPELAREIGNCLSEMLRDLMIHYKVNQHDVATKAEIAESTLSEWLNGKVRFQQSDKRLFNLAKVFGVTVDYLLYGIGQDPEAPTKAIDEIYSARKDKLLKDLLRKFEWHLPDRLFNEAVDLKLLKPRDAA